MNDITIKGDELQEIIRAALPVIFKEKFTSSYSNPIATKKLKKPIYFCKMTGIGPMTTDKVDEAMKFDNEQDAKSHPAYSFWFTDFQPIGIEL